MATYFCVSDVHSFYDEMIEALDNAGFDIENPNHIFISLGDLLDRGPKPKECLEFVNKLPKNRKILIKGNHERLMEQCIQDKIFRSHDFHNRTIDTVLILTDSITCTDQNMVLTKMEHNKLWNQYINDCIDYYETGKYIFVHGWIPCTQWEEGINLYGEKINNYDPLPDWRVGNWNRASWLNGMDCWNKNIQVKDKTILCGHYHSSWGHCFIHKQGIDIPHTEDQINENWHTEPFVDNGIICLDACTVLSGKVNCWKIDKQKKINKENKDD